MPLKLWQQRPHSAKTRSPPQSGVITNQTQTQTQNQAGEIMARPSSEKLQDGERLQDGTVVFLVLDGLAALLLNLREQGLEHFRNAL